MGRFNCARCGACCKDTVAQDGRGDLYGLYLTPEEAALFPKELVSPLLGSGQPVQVTAYQLSVSRCPHYSEEHGLGRCAIYERRPRTCRAFPVISRFSVSTVCPTARAIRDGIEPNSLRAELEAHHEKIDEKLARPPDEWVWPLNKKNWTPRGVSG